MAHFIEPVERLNHFFTPKECEALMVHGDEATNIELGFFDKADEHHARFALVCNGEVQPETRFEFLWLRYRQNCELDKRLSTLEREKDEWERRAHSFAKAIFHEVELRKELSQRFENQIAQLRQIAREYEARLGIPQERHADPDKIEWWREQE